MQEAVIPGDPADSVVLDIGQGIGALVVHTTDDLCGREIEVSPLTGGKRVHAVVHERQVAGRPTFAAVFPSLVAGGFYLWGQGNDPLREVIVADGQVTDVNLPIGALGGAPGGSPAP